MDFCSFGNVNKSLAVFFFFFFFEIRPLQKNLFLVKMEKTALICIALCVATAMASALENPNQPYMCVTPLGSLVQVTPNMLYAPALLVNLCTAPVRAQVLVYNCDSGHPVRTEWHSIGAPDPQNVDANIARVNNTATHENRLCAQMTGVTWATSQVDDYARCMFALGVSAGQQYDGFVAGEHLTYANFCEDCRMMQVMLYNATQVDTWGAHEVHWIKLGGVVDNQDGNINSAIVQGNWNSERSGAIIPCSN
jgi:hypothetical protein